MKNIPFQLKLSLILIVGLTPLIPALFDFGYEQIKVIFFLILTSLAGFLYILVYQKNPQDFKIKWSLVKTVSLIFILSLWLTSILGLDVSNSIFGKYPYYQGLLVYSYLFLFSLLISAAKIDLKVLSITFLVASLLVAFFALLQFLLIDLFNLEISTYAGRVVSSFGQPNLFAGFLVLAMPWIYLLSKDKKWKNLSLISLIFAALAIFISLSRAGLFLLLILGMFWLILKFSKVRWLIILLAITGILIATYLSFKYSSGLIWNEVTSLHQYKLLNYSAERRGYIWPIILDLISQKPIFGYGLENLSIIFSNYDVKLPYPFYFYDIKNLLVDRSHNYILDLAIFGGVISLGSWLILNLTLVLKNKNRFLFFALLIYLIWIQFQIQSIVHLIYFWLIVGLIDNLLSSKYD